MNEESQKQLENILRKESFELTDHDARFLRARRAYLTDEQIKKYAEHFRGLPKTTPVAQKKDEDNKKSEKNVQEDKVSDQPETTTTIGDQPELQERDPDKQ